MQSISSSSCFRIPIPNRVSLNSHRRLKYRPTTLSLSTSVSTFSIHLTTRSSSGKEDETQKNDPLLHLGCGGSDEVKTPEPQFQKPDPQFQEPEPEQSSPKRRGRKSTGRGISASMWWADLRAAFGQRFNWEGIVCFSSVLARDQHLVLPHVAVRDVRRIDWAELQRRGFKGVVFDKDNTITAPYCLTLWGPIAPSIEQCKSVFGPNIAIFSNSAGLHEYDHNGAKAKALEWAIGIKVIRHRVKKPAGAAEEIEKHFGCDSSQLIMVGDRPFTDIVYGNRNGFLTVLVEPLSRTEEPFIVRQVRKLEDAIVKRWSRKGLKPISHRLLPNPAECVKDSSSTT